MLKSKASLSRLIDTEIAEGLQPNRIILGGFSQGAAMTLLTGLSYDKPLAGLVCMSGWALLQARLQSVRFLCLI